MCTLATLALCCSPALAERLQADQLLLVVNQNIPEGRRLAQFYAQERGVPEGRIVEVDVPPGEQMLFQHYERQIVPPIRRFIRENGLEEQVRCIVTFYGMPLRIADRVNTAEEQRELELLHEALARVPAEAKPAVEAAEALAKELDSDFSAGSGQSIEELAGRTDRALESIARHLAPMLDMQRRAQVLERLVRLVGQLGGPAAVMEHFGRAELANPQRTPEQRQPWQALLQQLEEASGRMAQLQEQRFDADARQGLRVTIREHFGPFAYARILAAQAEYLTTTESAAALDNELALLWWNYYPRQRWQINPLFHRADPAPQAPRVVKVMRLDGPQPANVRDIIIHSIQAEREGLTGRFAIDSRGLGVRDAAGNPDAYGQFDQTLRNLASFVREHTQMEVVHNDEPEVFPPDSVEDVALYAGWYSLRNYVPAFTFNTGAVGYHIASAELLSLREVGERGWVRGLLGDGVVASFGPVAEPYLHSFPVPDEFFPLLMTGELTLAEVYWMTNPLVSWMICAIGDPLYRPFAENPQVGREVLPESMRTRMDRRASQDAEAAGR